MPNCYHVTTSTPDTAGQSIKDCAKANGGRVDKLMTDGRKTYSLVWYKTFEEAYRNLGPLTECLREKGHEVHEARVLADFDNIGLAGPDQSAG